MYLEHVNLTVADIDRSTDFYHRLLDFRVRWEGYSSSGRRASHIGIEGPDGTYLALFEGDARALEMDYHKVGFNHFGVVVDDLDATRERLEGLGAQVHLEGDYEPGRRLYFLDPDGYEVELVEYPQEAAS